MNKFIRDKTIAVLGSGLLGYYLAISIFQDIIWHRILLKVLPPINSRHLPQGYVGLFGALIALVLGYLLFTSIIEKKSFTSHKKGYLVAIGLLVILPLLTISAFRLHGVSWVKRAEATAPTEISLRADGVGSHIMFELNSSQASGISKSLSVEPEDLSAWGKMIENMELKEVVAENQPQQEPRVATMFISYRVSGKWYSKIVTYQGGLFEEWIANNRRAYYENSELEKAIRELFKEAGSIEYYNQAKIINSEIVRGKKPEATLTAEQFAQLTSTINEGNRLIPDSDIIAKFQDLFENGVKKEDTGIYALHLLKNNNSNRSTDNFMIYDKNTTTLMFEGVYYKIDLNTILDQVVKLST